MSLMRAQRRRSRHAFPVRFAKLGPAMANEDETKVGPRGFWTRAKEEAKRVSDRVAANAANLAGRAATASQSVQASEAYQRAREATAAARTRLESAAAEMQDRAKEAGETARVVVTTLASAANDLDDEEALTERFRAALAPLGGQLDCKADAVALGFLAKRGIGVGEVTGTEIFYLRPDGPVRAQIRVNAMTGRVARLAMGASTGGYVACLYGPRDALSRPTQRRGGDVGVVVASLGFFRATAHGDRVAHGWMVGMSAGLSFGIPILSDLVAFELDEQLQGGFALDRARAEKIEEIIERAPDRPGRRQLAKRL